jgi:hypothetical protein
MKITEEGILHQSMHFRGLSFCVNGRPNITNLCDLYWHEKRRIKFNKNEWTSWYSGSTRPTAQQQHYDFMKLWWRLTVLIRIWWRWQKQPLLELLKGTIHAFSLTLESFSGVVGHIDKDGISVLYACRCILEIFHRLWGWPLKYIGPRVKLWFQNQDILIIQMAIPKNRVT